MNYVVREKMIGIVLILCVALDLLWGWGNNIYDVLFPPKIVIPADGLPVAPEVAFGWLQVLVNGTMVLIVLWGLWGLMQSWIALKQAKPLQLSAVKISAYLIVAMFSLPAWYAWFGVLQNLLEGRWTVSIENWRYLWISICQAGLIFTVLSVVYRHWRPIYSHQAENGIEYDVENKDVENQ